MLLRPVIRHIILVSAWNSTGQLRYVSSECFSFELGLSEGWRWHKIHHWIAWLVKIKPKLGLVESAVYLLVKGEIVGL